MGVYWWYDIRMKLIDAVFQNYMAIKICIKLINSHLSFIHFSSYAYAQQPFDSRFEKDNLTVFPMNPETRINIYGREKNPSIYVKNITKNA